MYPIVLDLSRLPVALVGSAAAAGRRLAALDAASASSVRVYCPQPDAELARAAGGRLVPGHPGPSDLAEVRVLLVAGLDEASSSRLAVAARSIGVLVNVEDRPDWCDFHIPSVSRRGDLLITVSTAGRSPGLARRIRRFIEARFGPEWADRLAEIATRRTEWRASGADPAMVGRLSDSYIERRGWLR